MLKHVTFPAGLPAFPGKRHFSVEEVLGVPLARLVAQGGAGPDFLVLTAPAFYFPDLSPLDIDEQTAAVIGASERTELVPWLILAVRPGAVTANLLGPVVVNLANGLAAQVVHEDTTLPVAAPLPNLEEAHAR